MKNYPVKYGRSIHNANSVDSYTLEGARLASRNCGYCSGSGFAYIYNPEYQGEAVERAIDSQNGIVQVLMRSTAFCICPAGRKVAVLNQNNPESRDFFLRTPDLHDVIEGQHRDWIADDPTWNPDAGLDIEALPEQLRKLAAKLHAPKIYRELEVS